MSRTRLDVTTTPRVNESRGGGVLITRGEQHWFDPEKEALDLVHESGIEILN